MTVITLVIDNNMVTTVLGWSNQNSAAEKEITGFLVAKIDEIMAKHGTVKPEEKEQKP